MSSKIRVGIVGTGGMANAHARAYAVMPEVELVSCYDVVAERSAKFAEAHAVKQVATDLDGLLGEVDAVSVVTPDKYHAECSLAVLRSGKHLLCEKPLTSNLAEAREVAEAATQASAKGAMHMTNFSYRDSSAFQQAIKMVAAGEIGKVRHVHSFYLQSWLSSGIWGAWSSPGLLWRLDGSQSGGVLGDLGCHILDMTTAVSGDVKRVRCELRTFPKIVDGEEVTSHEGHQLDANDTAVIELELATGGFAVVQTTRWGTGHRNSLRCEVHGTEGALCIDLDKSYTDLSTCVGKDRDSTTWSTVSNPKTPTTFERFVRSIVTGEPDQPDVIRGAQIQAYLDACERSAKSGQFEAVESWLPG